MKLCTETLQRVGFRRDVSLNNSFQASRREQSPSPSDVVRNMSDDGDEFDPSPKDPDCERVGGRDLELALLRPEYLNRVSVDNKLIEEPFLTWRSNTQSSDDVGSVNREYRELEGTFKSQAPEDEVKDRVASPKRKGLEMPEERYVTKRSRSESLGNDVEHLEDDVLHCNANIRAPAQDNIDRFDHCPPKSVAVISGGDGDLSSADHGDGDHLGVVVQNENGFGGQYSSSLGLYHKNIVSEGLRPSIMVGCEKNGSSESGGLALDCVKEVDQCPGQEENGVKGSIMVGAQVADLMARDTVRSLQNCTDLTDLLDALSEDSDEGEEERSMDWAQEGAESEARNVLASSQKCPAETPPGRDSIHGTHLSSQEANCSSVPSASNSTPAKTEGGVSCQEGNVLSELTVPSAVSKECRDEFPEGEPVPSSGAPHQHALPIKEAVNLRSEGYNVRLPTMAESLAIHTIDVAVNMTRKVDGSGAPTPQAENNLGRSAPDVVILDSDSDEEGRGGHSNMHKSAESKNSVESEHERIRGNLKRGIEMVHKDEEGYPVLSSITSSGNFFHLVPSLGLRHGDSLHATCTPTGSSPFRDGNSHGHTLVPWNGLGQGGTPAYEAGPSNVYNHQFYANTHNHIPYHATGQEGTTVIGKIQEGPRLSLLEQLQIRSKMSNPTQSMLPQVHASANAYNQPGNSSTLPAFNVNDRPQTMVPPLQNGQSAASGFGGLVQVNQAFASTSQQPVWAPYPVAFFFQSNALAGSIHTGALSREQGPGKSQAWSSANKERVSPLNANLPQRRPDDKFCHPRSSVNQNRPSTSKAPSKERNSSLKNHAQWQQEVRQNSDGQAQSPLPHSRNSEPQVTESNLQLVVVQPNHDTTLTTPREAVRRTMDMYNFCVQEAQLKIEEQRLISAHSSFQTDQPSPSVPNVRVDIQAYREVKKENMDVNRNLIVGDVPGIEVGDVFNFRHQMAVVGLHHLPNVGIAYGYPDPEKDITATAVACVPKGGYNDNIDDGHSVLYTGQGGRSERSHAAPFVEHQKLEKGNKALWSNFQRHVPVRMIRGHANLSSPSNRKVLGYTYDGLYMIVGMDYSLGVGGFKVFKFKMERMEGQPPISPCLVGCTAHPWNDASQQMVVPAPLQMVEPEEENDVRQILGVEEADKSTPEDSIEVLDSEIRCKIERPN